MQYFSIKSILFVTLIFVFTSGYSQKQNTLDTLYSVKDLKSDFSILRSTLEEVHPGLYIHQTEQSLDSIFKATELKLNKPMTSVEFSILLGKLTSQLGDGHLKLAPPEVFFKTLRNGAYMLPFSVSSYGNKVYSSKDFSELNPKDFIGSQIISVNGFKMSDFLQEYLSLMSSDGANLTRKHRLLSSPMQLNQYFAMLNGFTSSYKVEYIPLNESTVKTVQLKGVSFEKLMESTNERYPKSDAEEQPIELKLDKTNATAYLRISTFSSRNYKKNEIDFKAFLINAFEKLNSESISNLIIDVRGNSGGEDAFGKTLFSHFVDKDFNYYKSLTVNKDGFDSFKYTERPDTKPPKGMFEKNEEGTFDFVRHPNVGIQKPSTPTYKGNILVLINGLSFSTTSEFMSLLHFHTDAIFIGEESGGGYYGNRSGMIPYFTMPKTKVRAKIPIVNYRLAVEGYKYTDRGIIPNYPMKRTIEDEINKIDVELDFAKKLIKKGF